MSAAGAASTLALALSVFFAAAPAAAQAQDGPLCSAPPGVDALEHPPVRIRERIAQRPADQDRRDRVVVDIRRGREQLCGLLSEPARGRAEGAASRPADYGAEQGHRRRGSRADGGALRRRRDRRSRPISCCGRSAAIRCCAIIRRRATMIRQGVERLKASGTEVDPDQSAIRAEDHRQGRRRRSVGRRHHGDRARRTRSGCSIASR